MSKLTLAYMNPHNHYEEVVMIDKILRLGKSSHGDYTLIYLVDGTRLETSDSIRTLEARLSSYG